MSLPPPGPPRRTGIRRTLLLALGMLCVGLGAIGSVTPLLPTTPFLLLAAFCFARSSPGLYRKLCSNAYLNSYLENYRTGCGVPWRFKLRGIAFLWIALAFSSLFRRDLLYWGILAAVGAGVTIHLLLLHSPGRPPAE